MTEITELWGSPSLAPQTSTTNGEPDESAAPAITGSAQEKTHNHSHSPANRDVRRFFGIIVSPNYTNRTPKKKIISKNRLSCPRDELGLPRPMRTGRCGGCWR